MTPATASLPYCAEAPSFNISILLMANEGIAFMSVPTLPLPTVLFTFTRDVLCLLLPLISTKTWSGPNPLKAAGSMWSVPSEMVCEVDVNEGAT